MIATLMTMKKTMLEEIQTVGNFFTSIYEILYVNSLKTFSCHSLQRDQQLLSILHYFDQEIRPSKIQK